MNTAEYYHIVIRGEDLKPQEALKSTPTYKASKPPIKKMNPATYNMWEILANPESNL